MPRNFLVIPLLILVILLELSILVAGWQYQHIACAPQGMGITFLGIGPIGAAILLLELLRLPLAAWIGWLTGWTKCIFLIIPLCLMSVIGFVLVRDMQVYEMTVAMAPANQLHAQAMEVEANNQPESAQTLLQREVQAIEATQIYRMAAAATVLRGTPAVAHSPAQHLQQMRGQITALRVWIFPLIAFFLTWLPPLLVIFCVAHLKPRRAPPQA